VSAAVQGIVDVAMRAVGDGEAARRRGGGGGGGEGGEGGGGGGGGWGEGGEGGGRGGVVEGRRKEELEEAGVVGRLARGAVEEEDWGKEALGVSRIITAAARVARARHAIGPAPEDTLQAFINERLREIGEVDRERGREAAAGRLPWGRTRRRGGGSWR